ncbi:PKD domain-containing protein [Halococcoides cellulosivorans]|uniref:mannan endo-1,4-beta-mannosidase n=1 Tax=Halococcoides cellulosivorans TaxID=1679096 RepID=A0A2R4X0X3_9EURY|nr:PKD domain-containing protein [Halococcoides cellulosivorans]AWB27450.1 hypothetical protein HARCEL1_06890 [Halococcoides cellulosivorans]
MTRHTDHSEPRSTTTRRRFLAAAGASAVGGLVGLPATAAPGGEFVGTEGTSFTLGGDPLYLNGSNNFWITNRCAERQRVDDVFQLYEEMGLNLVRTWTFCEGHTDCHCMQPEPGVHDESALKHLDYIVARAREHGLRLVLTFADFWPHSGGFDQYVEWVTGNSGKGYRAAFYVNEEIRELYRNHVETILTRTNSITGVEYREDPTIAMWELANEPRLEPKWADQLSIDDRVGAFEGWMDDMSAYVKDLDPNHLISSGVEGFFTRPDGENFLYSDWTAQDFESVHQIDGIDVCSFHMYPHHWPGLDLEPNAGAETVATGVEWIRDHVQAVEETVGKPLYLGEFNVNADSQSVSMRQDRLEAWYDELDAGDAGAATAWQLVLESTSDHDGFQIYRNQSGPILEAYADRVRAKSGDGSTPIADLSGPEDLLVGESGAFGASYSFDPDGSISDYDWSFGDGTSGSESAPVHRYSAPGTYDVDLTVSDETGNEATDSTSVTVEDVPEDTMIVEGAGKTVSDTTFEAHLATVPVSGDFTREAHLDWMDATAGDAQAGLIVVDDPADWSSLGAVTLTPDDGAEQTRAYSGTVWRERAEDDSTPPMDLRLERAGGTIHCSVSPDGESWTEIESGEIDMSEDAFVGVYVSSNSPETLCTARFDDVSWLDGFESRDMGDVAVAGAATMGGGSDPEGPTWPINATDPDGDGVYEDLSGNGVVDFPDVNRLFQNTDTADVQDNADFYDVDGDGDVDMQDVLALFEMV